MRRPMICVLVTVSASLFGGCVAADGQCYKKVTFESGASIGGTASMKAEYLFKSCLTRAEKTIVEEVKASVRDALFSYRDGKITRAEYNEYVEAADQAIERLQEVVEESVEPGEGFTVGERAAAFAEAYVLAAQRPR